MFYRIGFVWIGGAGLIHKGLDLLVETFSLLPEYTLELCGKYNDERFKRVYASELASKNIVGHGSVELGSKQFEEIYSRNTFIISTSCAEGQSGSVILGMHAGLIPIVSRECGVDTDDFGFTLSDCSLATIRHTIETCAALPEDELNARSARARAYALKHHTRAAFTQAFADAVDSISLNVAV